MARIYVASSWRNQYYPNVVEALRAAGHEVYDFRNPPHGGTSFHWTDVNEKTQNWTFREYAEGLHHPLAERQFAADLAALNWADFCVLVLPCGRSAHTEAGWISGRGKRVIVYMPEMQEPELMYKLFDSVVSTTASLLAQISELWTKGRGFTPINLGLSVNWADRNIGALIEEDPGELVGWRLVGRNWELCYRSGLFVEIPTNWRLPSWDEALELVQKCTREYRQVGEQTGVLFTGPSGKSVFLPYGGSIDPDYEHKNNGINYYGFYLCRTKGYNNSTFIRLDGKSQLMEPYGVKNLLLSARLVTD